MIAKDSIYTADRSFPLICQVLLVCVTGSCGPRVCACECVRASVCVGGCGCKLHYMGVCCLVEAAVCSHTSSLHAGRVHLCGRDVACSISTPEPRPRAPGGPADR